MASAGSAHDIPDPLEEDDGDVAWALASAQARWNQGSRADAIAWLRRAVEAALQARHSDRADELRSAAQRLATSVSPSDTNNEGGRRGANDSASRLMALIEDALVEGDVGRMDSSADLQVHGVALDQVRGLEHLMTTALQKLKELARIETLAIDEEVRDLRWHSLFAGRCA